MNGSQIDQMLVKTSIEFNWAVTSLIEQSANSSLILTVKQSFSTKLSEL